MTTTHSTSVAVADDGTSPVGSDEWNAAHVVEGAYELILDGGGGPISTGVKGDLVTAAAGSFASWTLLADVSGSIVIDLWKDTYANYPPTVADVLSVHPTISGAVKATGSISGSFAKGDVIRINVASCSTITRATLVLAVLE